MGRYLVKYRYGAGTSGQQTLDLHDGSVSEALAQLRRFCPSDVQVVCITRV